MVNGFHIAQFNIARAKAPLDDPQLADFMAKLDDVNALAESSPGFVWRLKSDSGNATDIRAFEDPRMIVNLSVWTSIDALFDFTYKSAHAPVMNRRREWFERAAGPHLVLWWLAAGTIPSVADAVARLELLTARGPSAAAFTLKARFSPPADLQTRAAGAFVC